MHNIFGYKYDPITKLSNKTDKNLPALSDIIRYNDAYRVLKFCYGDESHQHTLPQDFGKDNPDILEKYFSNIDEMPDRIKEDLDL